MTDAELTLQEAADALGVHYMTAYRYVRLGLLDANKFGGTWRVSQPALDTFRALGAQASVVQGRGRRRAPWAERLEARLLAGDARGAWGVAEAALAAGAGLEEVYLDIIAPAMRSIGDGWAAGEIDVADEHRATGIVVRLVARLGPRFARRGRTRGTIVVGAPHGEQHSLSISMLADLIRHRGWEVSDLGADVPAASFAYAAANAGDQLFAVGVSVSTAMSLPAAAEAIAAVREAVPHVSIFAGGGAVEDEAHAHTLGADYYVGSGRDIGQLLESLIRPRPGRRASSS